jgi:2-polyprenyl-6-methoxyphenol hydroxylase-like FAD-dependent oxidoreductase
MHPVTAHGFNFGLSGAERLAAEIRRASDPGAAAALTRYAAAHRRATLPLFLATNAVARLYSDDRAPARLARAALIGAGAVLAPVRKAIVAGLMDAPGGGRANAMPGLGR